MNEIIKLFPWELASMDDYSTTIPSGQTIGKMWRRFMNPYGKAADRDYWLVGQYARHTEPNQIRIRWMDVVLKEGPRPKHYSPPDWSKFKRWQRDHTPELGCKSCGKCA